MAQVATNANGLEFLFIEKPYRSVYREYGYWNPTYSGIGGCILIPHGSIKNIIGRELSFSDEPVELKEEQLCLDFMLYLPQLLCLQLVWVEFSVI